MSDLQKEIDEAKKDLDSRMILLKKKQLYLIQRQVDLNKKLIATSKHIWSLLNKESFL